MFTYLLIKLKGKEFILFIYFTIIYFLLSFLFHKFISFLFIYFIFLIIVSFSTLFILKGKYRFWIIFGLPGTGKTTIATSLSIPLIKKLKKNPNSRKVYANFSLSGADFVSKLDLSINDPRFYNCDIHLDEAGLVFDNRNFKSNFTPELLQLFKYHRKRHINFYFYSQEVDIDVKLRNLCNGLFYVKPSILPYFTTFKKIGTRIAVDKLTHQLIKSFYFVPFSSKYVFMPSTWKYFNTDKY